MAVLLGRRPRIRLLFLNKWNPRKDDPGALDLPGTDDFSLAPRAAKPDSDNRIELSADIAQRSRAVFRICCFY